MEMVQGPAEGRCALFYALRCRITTFYASTTESERLFHISYQMALSDRLLI